MKVCSQPGYPMTEDFDPARLSRAASITGAKNSYDMETTRIGSI